MFYGSINKTTKKFSSLTPKNTCTYGCYGNMLFLFSLSLSLSLSIYIYTCLCCVAYTLCIYMLSIELTLTVPREDCMGVFQQELLTV